MADETSKQAAERMAREYAATFPATKDPEITELMRKTVELSYLKGWFECAKTALNAVM